MKIVNAREVTLAGADVGIGAAYFGGMADVNAHIARVEADGGGGYHVPTLTLFFQELIGLVTTIDCVWFTHWDRVIADGGGGLDETAVRELLTEICEL